MIYIRFAVLLIQEWAGLVRGRFSIYAFDESTLHIGGYALGAIQIRRSLCI